MTAPAPFSHGPRRSQLPILSQPHAQSFARRAKGDSAQEMLAQKDGEDHDRQQKEACRRGRSPSALIRRVGSQSGRVFAFLLEDLDPVLDRKVERLLRCPLVGDHEVVKATATPRLTGLAVSAAGRAWWGPARADEKSLTLCWAAWDPANASAVKMHTEEGVVRRRRPNLPTARRTASDDSLLWGASAETARASTAS